MDKENMLYIHAIEYFSAIKKEILPFAATWMDLEATVLSKIRQKDKYFMLSLICGFFFLKRKKAHIYREQIGDCQ